MLTEVTRQVQTADPSIGAASSKVAGWDLVPVAID